MIADLTGTQLDAYRLIRRLGRGTFGDVYEATDMRRNERVAIKVMEALKSESATQQFYYEVRTLVRLRHPRIIPILDFGVDPVSGMPFIVMQYASSGSLRQRHPKGTRLPLATVVQYVNQLAEALQYAHDDRSIHRDIKPDNVLLGSSSELLLSDFGVTMPSSSLFIDLNQPAPQSVAGSPSYMAPEQCRGRPEKASDQYALAIMAYEWLCGEPPFTGDNVLNIWDQHINEPVPLLHEKLPDLAPQVEAVIMKALAKKPNDRYPSVSEFALALQENYKRGQEEKAKEQKIFDQSVQAHEDVQAREESNNLIEKANKIPAYDKEKAIPLFDQAIQIDPTNLNAYLNKAISLSELNRYEESLTVFDQAIQINPADIYAYKVACYTLNRLERAEEALAVIERGIQINSTNLDAYLLKGIVLGKLRRNEEALAVLEQAIAIDPTAGNVLVNKGIYLCT